MTHFQVSRMLRGKARSTQHPIPPSPSPASLRVVQRITEMGSRLPIVSNCEIAHNTPVQSERRKRRRNNCLVDIHRRLEEVMGAWKAVLLSGGKQTVMASGDRFQKTNNSDSSLLNHQLYFPSGKVEH